MPDWFYVGVSEAGIELDARPPVQRHWRASIAWADIQRICLEVEDFTGSDSLYVFVNGREASYVIPLEGDSRDALIDQLFTRRLVDAQQWIEAMASAQRLWCWPDA